MHLWRWGFGWGYLEEKKIIINVNFCDTRDFLIGITQYSRLFVCVQVVERLPKRLKIDVFGKFQNYIPLGGHYGSLFSPMKIVKLAFFEGRHLVLVYVLIGLEAVQHRWYLKKG